MNRDTFLQSAEFFFFPANIEKAKEIIKKYPEGKERSAVMPLLHLAQEQNKWISLDVMDYIARMLNIPTMHVYEVANFYTMYNKKPIGKNLIQICRTTPCWLCGAEKILNTCEKELGIKLGEITEDRLFSLVEVECLGACVNAPMVQINNDYYENLDEEKMIAIIKSLKDAG